VLNDMHIDICNEILYNEWIYTLVHDV